MLEIYLPQFAPQTVASLDAKVASPNQRPEEINGWLELRFPGNLQGYNTDRYAEHMETREEQRLGIRGFQFTPLPGASAHTGALHCSNTEIKESTFWMVLLPCCPFYLGVFPNLSSLSMLRRGTHMPTMRLNKEKADDKNKKEKDSKKDDTPEARLAPKNTETMSNPIRQVSVQPSNAVGNSQSMSV